MMVLIFKVLLGYFTGCTGSLVDILPSSDPNFVYEYNIQMICYEKGDKVDGKRLTPSAWFTVKELGIVED